MNVPGRERWKGLWQSAKFADEPLGWFERLIACYSEPHRHYHNLQHIAECLREFDSASHLAKDPAAVELAIWFHDVIYDPRAADNEERSAVLAQACLTEAGAAEDLIRKTRQLILATKHKSVPADEDAKLLVDVDLSILGQPEARFQDYEGQIRNEYAWVSPKVFARRRAEMLDSFLQRPRIFATDWFFTKYEEQARVNLARSISRLHG